MNFQEKWFETTADLRIRAAALASDAVATARARANVAAKRIQGLKSTLDVLTVAGREFNKVARRHVIRLVQENATIASEARDDVSSLARRTYSTLATRRRTGKSTARKSPSVRKRAKAKAS